MTRELLEKRLGSCRKFGVAAFCTAGVLGIGPLCFFLLAHVFKWSPVDKYTELAIIAFGVLSYWPVLGILAYWGERRCQVLCPHCGQSLMKHYPVVIATGKCTRCRRTVIDYGLTSKCREPGDDAPVDN